MRIERLEDRVLFSVLAGDIDGDGAVGDADFAVVLENFGGSGPDGDCNGDGIVDLQDFGIVKEHFGMIDLPDPVAPLPYTYTENFHQIPPCSSVGPDDPKQGFLSDCWLIASMCALAQAQPETVAGLITPNNDSTFTVHLSPDDVTIDADLPTGSYGYLPYAQMSPDGESWPCLIEKAFAQVRGGYAALSTGLPSYAFQALVGAGSQVPISLLNEAEQATLLADLFSRNVPVVASTGNNPPAPLSGNHSYAVLDAYTLRDPHTRTLLSIDAATFKAAFPMIYKGE